MPSTCCVPGCTTSGGFPFPEDPERRKKWIAQVSREGPKKSLWKPQYFHRVCYKHFKKEDIVTKKAVNSSRVWRALTATAIPLKTGSPAESTTGASARSERAKRRRLHPAEVSKGFLLQHITVRAISVGLLLLEIRFL